MQSFSVLVGKPVFKATHIEGTMSCGMGSKH